MMRMMNHWAHDQDPLDPLFINRKVSYIRHSLSSDPSFFQSLIRHHLLSNPSRVTLVMSPDEDYARKENDREAARVQRIAATLTQEDRRRIDEAAAQLKVQQDTLSDPTILPTLSITDIKREAERVDLQPVTLPSAPAAAISTPPPATAALGAAAGFGQLTGAAGRGRLPFPPVVRAGGSDQRLRLLPSVVQLPGVAGSSAAVLSTVHVVFDRHWRGAVRLPPAVAPDRPVHRRDRGVAARVPSQG